MQVCKLISFKWRKLIGLHIQTCTNRPKWTNEWTNNELVWAELWGIRYNPYVITYWQNGHVWLRFVKFKLKFLASFSVTVYKLTCMTFVVMHIIIINRRWSSIWLWSCINSYELNMLNNGSHSNHSNDVPVKHSYILLPFIISMC